MTPFLYYCILINIISIALMYIDKQKAKRHRWRIPEKTLFIVSMVFGSPGVWLGMYIFRHKTKHLSFVIGIPAIMIIQTYIIFRFVW